MRTLLEIIFRRSAHKILDHRSNRSGLFHGNQVSGIGDRSVPSLRQERNSPFNIHKARIGAFSTFNDQYGTVYLFQQRPGVAAPATHEHGCLALRRAGQPHVARRQLFHAEALIKTQNIFVPVGKKRTGFQIGHRFILACPVIKSLDGLGCQGVIFHAGGQAVKYLRQINRFNENHAARMNTVQGRCNRQNGCAHGMSDKKGFFDALVAIKASQVFGDETPLQAACIRVA